jgi:ABC-type branched-subunit amino acid transport system ATPase component
MPADVVEAGEVTPALEMRSTSMHFGGVKAVTEVSITVRPGHLHSLIGPNGSGKSTTINVLSGIYRPTAGHVLLDGQDVTRRRPDHRVRLGLARTFQNIRLFKDMSTVDNVMVGRHSRMSHSLAGVVLRPAARREERECRERAAAELDFMGLLDEAHVIAGSLSYGRQRMLEIARALATDPRVLLLDEPAAGLNENETEELTEVLRRIVGRGITVFLVEHDMPLVMGLSDRITVLNFGRKIAEGTPDEVRNDPSVIAAYLGSGEEEVVDA